MKAMDGLRPVKPPMPATVPIVSRPLKPASRWYFWLLPVIVLMLISLVTVQIQPILAALPLTSWSDRLTLAEYLKPGKYLVLFQNNRELRPTGGFLGSFAEVDLGWRLHHVSLKIETNIYNRDKQYATQVHLTTPEPLQSFVGDTPWAMRDSNWPIDFPEAAKLVAYFYEHEGGQPVDGVIALNAQILERILTLTGSIRLDSYDITVTANTVVSQLEQEIEKNYWTDPAHKQENQPKSILADLLPSVIKKLEAQSIGDLSTALLESFKQKEIQIYSTQANLAKVLNKANWDGHVIQTTGDYLYINEANLSVVDGLAGPVGAKSSWSNKQSVSYDTHITTIANVNHQLTLKRTHEGAMVWPDGPNQSYLRVAVPLGSTLQAITQNGQSIIGAARVSEEAGKTVFGFWSKLKPGDTETTILTYLTPTVDTSSIVIQKQSGSRPSTYTIQSNQQAIWQGTIDQDKIFANANELP